MKKRKLYLLRIIPLLGIIILLIGCISNKKDELVLYSRSRDKLLEKIINSEASKLTFTQKPTIDEYIEYLNTKTDSLYNLLFSHIDKKSEFFKAVTTADSSKIIIKYIPYKSFKITINYHDNSEVCETYNDINLDGFNILKDKYIRVEDDKSYRTPSSDTIDIIEFNNLLKQFIKCYYTNPDKMPSFNAVN